MMHPFGPSDPPPERRETEPEQEEEPEPQSDVDLVARDSVLRHRAAFFALMGMNPRQSRALAIDRRVDTHWVADRLIARGCPPDIAFDIASY